MTASAIASSAAKLPPTLPGYPFIGSALAFARAGGLPLKFLQDSFAEYGDVFRAKVFDRSIVVVSHPDMLHEILVKRVSEFHKPIVISPDKPRSLERFLGAGILTGDHAEWRPQRKLIQPLMHAKHIEGYAETMVQHGAAMLNGWHAGQTLDVHAAMTQVTMSIIAETMFGTDVSQTSDLEFAGRKGQEIALADLMLPLPTLLMGPRNRRAAVVNGVLSALVARFMAERRETGHGDRTDLLSLLMQTTDEDGQPMPDDFVRNNILTLFFAGHETTANTLTWALHFLDRNPEVKARLQHEVDTALDGRAPTLEDLRSLPYTLMVIKEAMRAEPVVAALSRVVTEDNEIGGYHLDKGTLVLLPIYLMHHDPRWWVNPERFDPERFSAENEPNIHKFAYIPFGGGPRVCIGNHFSMMESQLLLAMMVSQFELAHAPGHEVVPTRQITTSPKTGLWMQLSARHRE